MSHPAIDQIIKTMAVRDPEQFARLLFPNAKFKIVSVKLDKELRIHTRMVDQVFKLQLGKQKYLLHLEFLTRYKATVAKDIFIYSAGLTNNYKLKTISALFLVKPRAGAHVSLGRYVVDPHGIETNAFTFPIIQLSALRDAILAGKKEYLGFLPLLLDIFPKPDLALLKKQRELMNLLEKDPERFKEILGLSAILARRYFAKRILDKIYKENTAMVTKQLIKKFPGLKEPVQEIEEEAREEGAFSTFQLNLLDLLEARFGALDKKTLATINSIRDLKSLRSLFKKALRLQSSEALLNLIASFAKKNGRHNGRKRQNH